MVIFFDTNALNEPDHGNAASNSDCSNTFSLQICSLTPTKARNRLRNGSRIANFVHETAKCPQRHAENRPMRDAPPHPASAKEDPETSHREEPPVAGPRCSPRATGEFNRDPLARDAQLSPVVGFTLLVRGDPRVNRGLRSSGGVTREYNRAARSTEMPGESIARFARQRWPGGSTV